VEKEGDSVKKLTREIKSEGEMNNDQPTSPETGSRRSDRSSRSIWLPIILIAVGVLFLLQRVGNFSFDNWWALFILIPALSAFGSAAEIWRRSGRFTFAVWSAFYGGLFPLLVALMFLFNLDWSDYWPLFIILGGFGVLVSGLPRHLEDAEIPRAFIAHRPWAIFLGLAAALLGITFLAFNLDLIQTFPFFAFENWWGIFIIIAALGGLVTALILVFRGRFFLALINLGAAAIIFFTGIVALYNLDWNLLSAAGPLLLILIGLGLIISVGITNKRKS
jgi:hypothetical protein